MNLPDETFNSVLSPEPSALSPESSAEGSHQSPITNHQSPPLINIGVGQDISIIDLAVAVAEVVGFNGDLEFDTSEPDGTPQKLLDVSRLTMLGWRARTALPEGLRNTYQDFFLRLGGKQHAVVQR